ncbi:MAG: hypothetical protein NT075_20580 [Chloroflexi bacterium]|nr:hypothetical protein [Chloroflexota bacterium]
MKKFIGLLLLIFAGAVGWRVGGGLSSDAVSMAVGVLFGVLAGVPTALLLLAAERRRSSSEELRRAEWGRDRNAAPGHHLAGSHYPAYQPQAPVIVLTGAPTAGQQLGYGLPAPVDPRELRSEPQWPGEREPARAQRQFKVVGEKEEWVDEW